MNTITFKGISSTTLTGLVISELAPISRAPRRVEVTQVDGLDGDVVNYLGYDSYDKEVQIGLHGSYDIDAIIHFFSGEGDVIFSNEPTKKYHARIVKDVNFDRLVRYRTAKVVFTVQPYKKLVGEASVSGNTSPLTVTNHGYEDCLPTITIAGAAAATITLKIDTVSVATVTIPPEGTITIDGEALNCYNSNADKNQYVVLADFPTLSSGDHSISWTGSATVTVVPNSRWL